MALTQHNLLSLVFLLIISISLPQARGWLRPGFYSSSCPTAQNIVRKQVAKAIKKETRIGASLLRLHFHDCFVNGCDGSVLLDDNSTFIGEKTALPNKGSIRGFEVVDAIKANLEKACPRVVSWMQLGGPSWRVQLGRRDSLTASKAAANTSLPGPFLNLVNLTKSFAAVGLSFTDMVTLSGAHTIGFARCSSYNQRIYNDANIDLSFAKKLQSKCPKAGSTKVLQGLDLQTEGRFDNKYYQNMLIKKGLLHSDQELFNGNSADSLTKKFASDQTSFFNNFAKSMIKMGNIKPLTGKKGEIRATN
ncbi:hypothetical protein V2J09_014139 [Rumex salicifolius]